MEVFRSVQFEVSNSRDLMIGDQIKVDKHTATCQKVYRKEALFLLDQYLDKAYKMNEKGNNNRGGYETSDLRKYINSDEVLNLFSDIRDIMLPLENGDLVRIPYVEEMFGKVTDFNTKFTSSRKKQWELMKDRRNRIADRKGRPWEFGWLQNKDKLENGYYARVYVTGNISCMMYIYEAGIRPVFKIKF